MVGTFRADAEGKPDGFEGMLKAVRESEAQTYDFSISLVFDALEQLLAVLSLGLAGEAIVGIVDVVGRCVVKDIADAVLTLGVVDVNRHSILSMAQLLRESLVNGAVDEIVGIGGELYTTGRLEFAEGFQDRQVSLLHEVVEEVSRFALELAFQVPDDAKDVRQALLDSLVSREVVNVVNNLGVGTLFFYCRKMKKILHIYIIFNCYY